MKLLGSQSSQVKGEGMQKRAVVGITKKVWRELTQVIRKQMEQDTSKQSREGINEPEMKAKGT